MGRKSDRKEIDIQRETVTLALRMKNSYRWTKEAQCEKLEDSSLKNHVYKLPVANISKSTATSIFSREKQEHFEEFPE